VVTLGQLFPPGRSERNSSDLAIREHYGIVDDRRRHCLVLRQRQPHNQNAIFISFNTRIQAESEQFAWELTPFRGSTINRTCLRSFTLIRSVVESQNEALGRLGFSSMSRSPLPWTISEYRRDCG